MRGGCKAYSVPILLSIALFSYGAFQTTPIVVNVHDFLGLTSRLNPAYWVGLSILVLCSVLAYFDSGLKNAWVFLLVLLALALFLFGIRAFVEANPADPYSFEFISTAEHVMRDHHVDPFSRTAVQTYDVSPAIGLWSAALLYVSGIEALDFLKYYSLLWVVGYISITFLIARRLGLAANRAFLVAVLVLCASWTLWHNSFSAQSLALILYLLSFAFLIGSTKTRAQGILGIVTFASLVITHGLTAFSGVLSVGSVRLFSRRGIVGLAVFACLFLTWYALVAFGGFQMGVYMFWYVMADMDFFACFRSSPGYSVAPSLARMASQAIRLAYPAIFGLCVATGVLLYLKKRVDPKGAAVIRFSLTWILGLAPLLLMGYGEEIEFRFFVLSIVPMACIMVAAFSTRRLRASLMILMILLIFLHVPATYSTESIEQTTDSELEGARFFAAHGLTERWFYYGGSARNLFFFKPELRTNRTYIEGPASSSRTGEIEPSYFNAVEYVLDSAQGRNFFIYTYGHDPLDAWKARSIVNLTYDNGDFRTYQKVG